MNLCEQILSRNRTNPICNFKIVELILDMIVYITVNNRQLKTLCWALCMKIKSLSLRDRQLISVFLGHVKEYCSRPVPSFRKNCFTSACI